MKRFKKNFYYMKNSTQFEDFEKMAISYPIKYAFELDNLKFISDYLEISIDWLVRKDLTKKTRKQMKDNYYKVQEKLKPNAK